VHLSKLWSKAYSIYQNTANNYAPSNTSWIAGIIPAIWEYTSSLWEHRNGVLHRHTLTETAARELDAVQLQIITAYSDYNKDNFIVP
jgi:hypothetical protein